MLKNNVIIEMKSVQFIDNEKTETELITKGNYTKQNDSWHISYEDSEATGFEGSVTEICVIGNKFASIIRTGEAHSDLVIEPKKKASLSLRNSVRLYGYRHLHSFNHK